MATAPQSRNPFADPNLPSFADLIARIETAEQLPLRNRQNWAWSLRAVARAIGSEPTAVPAHPEFLNKLLDRAAPASLGISRLAWNNARSLCGKVLEWAGLASMPGHYQAPFAPDWAALWSKLQPSTAVSFQLARLFHYCSAQRISPNEVDDGVLAAFYRALIAESIVRLPYEIYRGAAKSWNNAADRILGWPQQRLTVPSRRVPVFCLPWSAFPATLQIDVETYCRRAAGLDLSDDHFSRVQRPATIQIRQKQLRLFASAIHKSGVPLADLVDLRAILEPEIAARGLQLLVKRNNGKSRVQISNLADFLPTLAARLDMPAETIGRLRKMKAKLKVGQFGMTTRNREVLRAFDDQAAVEALLRLPQRLLRVVQATGKRGYREAKLLQTAVAIELLLNAPVRIANLVSIDIDRHLVEVGVRNNRTVHLHFPAAEVKNANDLEFPLMPESVELLDFYLRDWRPLLVTRIGSLLFPGKVPGQPKGNGALSTQIKQIVYAYTRLDMPAHRFRHAVAKIFLDRNPGQYEVVRQLLGHKDIRTTVSFYAGTESATAARHYAKTILELRRTSSTQHAPHD
jgi:integrase